MDDFADWARKHPWKAAAYGTLGTASVVAVAAPAAVAAPVLGVVGFGSSGVIGGECVHDPPHDPTPFSYPSAPRHAAGE